MPVDLTGLAQQLRYVTRDRLSPGTPVADIALAFADSIEGIHYEFGAAIRRLSQMERQVAELEQRMTALEAPKDPPA